MTNTTPPSSTDTLSLSFFNPMTNATVGQNMTLSGNGQPNQQGFALTEFVLEKDFFQPSNSFAITISNIGSQLTCENSISSWMQNGLACIVTINTNTQMVGYVFQYQLHINRHRGTTVVFHLKDLLELMAQGSCMPIMSPLKQLNYHFSANTTLGQALTYICQGFCDITGLPLNINVQADDSQDKQIASGFGVGVAVKGKTPASRQKSLTNALNHLTIPDKGESYLAYMLRLAKHAGANLRMSDWQNNTIICKPPTYNRSVPTVYQLYHLLSAHNNLYLNNVKDAHYYFDNNEQYSCEIMEANTTASTGQFYQQTFKSIALNELTAYPPGISIPTTAVEQLQALNGSGNANSISTAIQALTNGNLGVGYSIAPFNEQLYAVAQSLPIQNTGISLPHYSVNTNAHTAGSSGECDFAASKALSEKQDKYCQFIYEVQGWSDSQGYVWQPDMMCNILEETFSPCNPQNISMWIRRVTFTKSRGQGTKTTLLLSLPYTHNFFLSD